MSLFRDSVRPPPLASDAALRRYIELVRADIEPDPLFRRRLRGLVTNRSVAAREGSLPPTRSPGRAIGRLGRAGLYASLALVGSVGVTMAASLSAVPGDPLYAVKLRIEELRVMALPAEFRDDLAIYALSERIDELGRLSAAGKVEQADALLDAIEAQIAVVAAMDIAADTESGLLSSRLEVLDTLVDRLPPKAQQAVERAMAGSPGIVKSGPGPATGHGQDATANGGQGRVPVAVDAATTDSYDSGAPDSGTSDSEVSGSDTSNAGTSNGGAKAPTDQVTPPAVTPKPTPTPRPTGTPKVAESGQGADAEGDENSD
jgi:hypothetical protein